MHHRQLSGEWLPEPDFQGRPATTSGVQMFHGGAGTSETPRLSARVAPGAASDHHNHLPPPHAPRSTLLDTTSYAVTHSHATYDGGHGAVSHLAPSTHFSVLDSVKQHPRSPSKSSLLRRTLVGMGLGSTSGSRGGGKKVWRQRVKVLVRVAAVVLLFYFFGRTAYQLTFFVKAGVLRYWKLPLEKMRPIPCGVDTLPHDALLATLEDKGVATTGRARGEVGRGRQNAASDVISEVNGGERSSLTASGGVGEGDVESASGRRVRGGYRRYRQGAGGRGLFSSQLVKVGVSGGASASPGSSWGQGKLRRSHLKIGSGVNRSTATTRAAGSKVNPAAETSAPLLELGVKRGTRFAILTLCDANAGYICTASAANKRQYATLHGYDLIVSTEVADRSRPAAWSKILEVRKHLPQYDWLMFIDVDTLIMNPEVRLEDIADDSVDQVIAADHNGVNSGVWLVRNTPWMMWFLDELWAQEQLVRGPYLFHYEQRAFHHLFRTEPWVKQASLWGSKPYGNSADVRAHSKIVNQCVFNTMLPWYVSGDFVVHLAGLKGVWECIVFWYYFDLSQERPGMRVTDAQWEQEIGHGGGRPGTKGSTLWKCLKFKTLF